MTTPTTTSEVPTPYGATKVCDWDDVGNPGEARLFIGRRWTIAGAGWHPDDI